MFSNDLFFTKHECITKGELKAAALAGNILGQFACAKIIAQVDAKSFVRAITKAHTYTDIVGLQFASGERHTRIKHQLFGTA